MSGPPWAAYGGPTLGQQALERARRRLGRWRHPTGPDPDFEAALRLAIHEIMDERARAEHRRWDRD